MTTRSIDRVIAKQAANKKRIRDYMQREQRLKEASIDPLLSKLSPTMVFAWDFGIGAGGELVRFAGGYWTRSGNIPPHCEHYGTPTIEALVRRGGAEYTEWKDGARGRFPIRVKMKSANG